MYNFIYHITCRPMYIVYKTIAYVPICICHFYKHATIVYLAKFIACSMQSVFLYYTYMHISFFLYYIYLRLPSVYMYMSSA